jgi:iron complex outermembrane receptor protein
MTQWRKRLGDTRLELNANLGGFASDGSSIRRDLLAGALRPVADDTNKTRENSGNFTIKATRLLGTAPAAEHSLVYGGEFEIVQRDETRTSRIDGVAQLGEFGDELKAKTLRTAAYIQDEWNLSPKWAVHAGLRWEGIRTQGTGQGGTRPENSSSVATPLVHLLWKPNPARREQVRMSFTRSYRSPETAQLIARPSVNSRYPVAGPNVPTAPDSAGNPNLKPELANGIDIAYERYFDGGGLLSANLFARLDQLIKDALRVEMRHNVSVYRSRVDGIPGPDNRLDQQAPWLANFGADYRLRGMPLTLGGTVGLTGGYDSRLALDRSTSTDRKRVIDVFGLWTFSPAVGLRLLASNLAPQDYETGSVFTAARTDIAPNPTPTLRETQRSVQASDTNWQLRLELKL